MTIYEVRFPYRMLIFELSKLNLIPGTFKSLPNRTSQIVNYLSTFVLKSNNQAKNIRYGSYKII
jgi:hypothetical protein